MRLASHKLPIETKFIKRESTPDVTLGTPADAEETEETVSDIQEEAVATAPT